MKTSASIGLLALACMSANAEESNWGFVTALGWAGGGQEILSGYIYDVNNHAKTVPFSVRAGNGLQLRIGAEYHFSDDFSAQATIGRSVYDPMGINGSVTFTTTPIELLANYRATANTMIGLGVRKTYADLQGTGVASGWSPLGSYDGSVGSVLEFKYMIPYATPGRPKGSGLGIHVRFVSETLHSQQYEINGDHYEVGVTLHY